MQIAHTRAMISAVLEDRLCEVPTTPAPIFGVHVPAMCPDVPAEVLQPRTTRADPAAYDTRALDMARSFADNFKQFAAMVAPEVAAAGPRL